MIVATERISIMPTLALREIVKKALYGIVARSNWTMSLCAMSRISGEFGTAVVGQCGRSSSPAFSSLSVPAYSIQLLGW